MKLTAAPDFRTGLEQLDANTLSLLSFHLSSNDNQRSRNLIQIIAAGLGLCTRDKCGVCPLKSCWDMEAEIDWHSLIGDVDKIIGSRIEVEFDSL